MYGLPTPRHLLKIHPWTVRLIAATDALNRSIAQNNGMEIVRGIEDTSFWVGRIMCDGIGGTGQALEHQEIYHSAVQAIINAQTAIIKGRKVLHPSNFGAVAYGSPDDPRSIYIIMGMVGLMYLSAGVAVFLIGRSLYRKLKD